MVELSRDLKAIAAARRYLLPDEQVMWAARQSGVGRRGLLVFAAHGLWMLGIWGITTLMGAPSFILVWLIIISPFYLFWTVEMLSRRFIATNRRVLFISGAWPFRSSYWNYSELDVHWLRFGKGRNIINLLPYTRGLPNVTPRGAVYPNYIENVPGIESVREFILEQIAHRPAPVEEPVKVRKPREPRGPRPRMHGTRTG